MEAPHDGVSPPIGGGDNTTTPNARGAGMVRERTALGERAHLPLRATGDPEAARTAYADALTSAAKVGNRYAVALLRGVFGTSVPVTYQRTPDGVSTQVYRIWRGSDVFYLRIAEEAHENLETDAELHRRLRDLGVKVADIVHVEPFNADIGRSTLVTTQVPGVSLAEICAPALAASLAEQAGADLAVINQIPVDRFGVNSAAGSDHHGTTRSTAQRSPTARGGSTN
jgi:hypothetical protein